MYLLVRISVCIKMDIKFVVSFSFGMLDQIITVSAPTLHLKIHDMGAC